MLYLLSKTDKKGGSVKTDITALEEKKQQRD